MFKQLSCTLLAFNIGPAPKLCSRPRAWLMRPRVGCGPLVRKVGVRILPSEGSFDED